MSKANLAKSFNDYWRDVWERYQSEHPGPFRVEDLVEWAVIEKEVILPKVDPKRVLERQARRALREIRIKDPSGTKVRGMLPAKLPVVDENNNLVLEVVWDHIHQMSVDHALLSFEQRDKNINKQQRSATRDLRSFLAHNPNADGHAEQFVFDFITDEPQQVVTKVVSESPKKPTRPR